MKQHNFDQHIKEQIDTYDTTNKPELDKNELWNTLNNHLHPAHKVTWLHIASAAALILLVLNFVQFYSNQQIKSKLNKALISYNTLENEMQNEKEIIKVTLEENEKYEAQIQQLRDQHIQIENQLIAERNKKITSEPKTLTKYIVSTSTPESQINEKNLITKPKKIESSSQRNDAQHVRNSDIEENVHNATFSGTQSAHNQVKVEDKPLFRIRFGNNYKDLGSDKKHESQTSKKLVIKTYL